MDTELLSGKGMKVGKVQTGRIKDFSLRVGDRATLVPNTGSQAHGIVADLSAASVESLYADEPLSDYIAETVTVQVGSRETIDAVCYNLPFAKIGGTNRNYARSLLDLATRLDLPESYLDEIRAMT